MEKGNKIVNKDWIKNIVSFNIWLFKLFTQTQANLLLQIDILQYRNDGLYSICNILIMQSVFAQVENPKQWISSCLSRLAVGFCSEGKTEGSPIVTATAILKITGLGKTGKDEGGKSVFLFQIKTDPDDLFGRKQLAGATHLFWDWLPTNVNRPKQNYELISKEISIPSQRTRQTLTKHRVVGPCWLRC